MQTALYIVLALLVAAAIGLQVWSTRAVGVGEKSRTAPFVILRMLNLVLLIGTIALVVFLMARR